MHLSITTSHIDMFITTSIQVGILVTPININNIYMTFRLHIRYTNNINIGTQHICDSNG